MLVKRLHRRERKSQACLPPDSTAAQAGRAGSCSQRGGAWRTAEPESCQEALPSRACGEARGPLAGRFCALVHSIAGCEGTELHLLCTLRQNWGLVKMPSPPLAGGPPSSLAHGALTVTLG